MAIITLGAKGSSLSSASVYAVAAGHAQVRIDSSVLAGLGSNATTVFSPTCKVGNVIPKTFAIFETRAALTVLLNKFLLSSSLCRRVLPLLIVDTLNFDGLLDLDSIQLTKEEHELIETSSAGLIGVLAILDHEMAALATFLDGVTSLSCEVVGADVASFEAVDAGNMLVDKEAASVAANMRVMVDGSKLVRKVESAAIAEIPKLHGTLRQVVNSLHYCLRLELNSTLKFSEVVVAKSVVTTVSPLLVVLYNVGQASFSRAKMNLTSSTIASIHKDLVSLFDKGCPSKEFLISGYKTALDSLFEERYVKFVSEVNKLFGIVWKIVAWETVTAFVALEGDKLSDVNNSVESTRAIVKADKEVVLGKGTSLIVQLIRDKFLVKGVGAGDGSGLLESWVECILSSLHITELKFDGVLENVKEFVRRNVMIVPYLSRVVEPSIQSEGIVDLVEKKRQEYENEAWNNRFNYANWLEYVQFEETVGRKWIRKIFQSAIRNLPPADEKLHWQQYVDLCISYALYEELDAGYVGLSRDAYRNCLELIPHKEMLFSKVSVLAAEFEMRHLNLTGARQILCSAIQKAHRDEDFMTKARKILRRCLDYYKKSAPELTLERAELIEEWTDTETKFGNIDFVPEVVQKIERGVDDDGRPVIVYDFFEKSARGLKILQSAFAWRGRKVFH